MNRPFENDYEISRQLRKRFREDKKARKELSDEASLLAEKAGLAGIPILPEDPQDREMARKMPFKSTSTGINIVFDIKNVHIIKFIAHV